MTQQFKYQGNELELFQHARKWKKYFSRQIKPFIKNRVLEVGAGIGSTTLLLNDHTASSWIMLEPDDTMVHALQQKLDAGEFPSNCDVQKGTIDTVSGSFDTIIYIDVLEHIESDQKEMEKAAAKLDPGGHLLILSPAFQHLYNPFDKAIGHYRRYTRKMMSSITPTNTELVSCRYYDSTGYFAALMNKLLLRKKYPSLKEVKFWDNWLVPLSRITDPLLFHSFGKSIIGVWRKK